MPREISIEEIEQRAQRALQDRMSAVRDLVEKRQSVLDARALVEQAEREAGDSYATALSAGWTESDLRDYGLGDVAANGAKPKRARAPRKARAPRAQEGSAETSAPSNDGEAES